VTVTTRFSISRIVFAVTVFTVCIAMDADAVDLYGGDASSAPAQLLHAAPLPDPVRITPSFLGSRIWAASDRDIFAASGRRVYRVGVEINAGLDPAPTEAPTRNLRSVNVVPDCVVEHDAPISSITGLTVARQPKIIVTCDIRGGVNLVAAPNGQSLGKDSGATRLPIESADDGENGWTGAALDIPGSHAIIARNFQRSLSIIDLETQTLVRNFRASLSPTRVAILGAGGDAGTLGGERCGTGVDGLIAMAEGHIVSLWDSRVRGRNACVARVMGSMSSLYALAWGKGTVAAGGADRSIYIFEPRKWSICGRAMAVCKVRCPAAPRPHGLHGRLLCSARGAQVGHDSGARGRRRFCGLHSRTSTPRYTTRAGPIRS
jgi:hypothetical protein